MNGKIKRMIHTVAYDNGLTTRELHFQDQDLSVNSPFRYKFLDHRVQPPDRVRSFFTSDNISQPLDFTDLDRHFKEFPLQAHKLVPDWSKAPPGHNYWARDRCGTAYFYMSEPSTYTDNDTWAGEGSEPDLNFFEDGIWRTTLRIRAHMKLGESKTPNWDALPSWANYWSIDPAGQQRVFSHRPYINDDDLTWEPNVEAHFSFSQYLYVPEWYKTLQVRP